MNLTYPRPQRIGMALLVVLALSGCSRFGGLSKSKWNDALCTALRVKLESVALTGKGTIAGEGLKSPLELARFYQSRDYAPAWTEGTSLIGQTNELRQGIRRANEDGLRSETYHQPRLDALIAQHDKGLAEKDQIPVMAELDLLLSDAFLTYGSDLAYGAVNPLAIDPQWATKRRSGPVLYEELKKALTENSVAKTLEDLAPQSDTYRDLKTALREYRGLASNDGANEARVHEIEANLERWRWLPRNLGDRYIFVDIPSFELRFFKKNVPVLKMPVVVGKPDHETPVLDDAITYIVLNPSWNVPRSIVIDELLPKLKENPRYLVEKGLQVIDPAKGAKRIVNSTTIDWKQMDAAHWHYLVRQPPGPKNALGKIKFAFPNVFDVYLHGTPEKAGFRRLRRAESHGCVRAERPLELATAVLEDNGRVWTQEELTWLIALKKEKVISLTHPVRVHLFYTTVWTDTHHQVHFREDIYHWDPPLIAALEQAGRPEHIAE